MTVLAGAMLLAQSGLLVRGVFLGQSADPKHPPHGHDPKWGFWLAPAIPAFLSLLVGLLSGPVFLANFLADAATASYGAKVKVSLALWTGINVPLLLSVAAVTLGSLLFWQLARVRPILSAFLPRLSANAVYDAALKLIDLSARASTLLQRGQIRFYISIMLLTTIAIVVAFGGLPVEFFQAENLLVLPTVNWLFPFLRVSAWSLRLARPWSAWSFGVICTLLSALAFQAWRWLPGWRSNPRLMSPWSRWWLMCL